MRKHSVGFLIGRFQPFHFGHAYLFREALKQCNKLIVGIGSSNVHDAANPYSFEIRTQMLEAFFRHENISNRIIKVIPIPDIPDDNEWLKMCLTLVPEFDVVVGDNEWVNGIFEKAGYQVLRIGHYKRDIYQGQIIRKLQKENGKWESRVPEYVLEIINADALSG